jgi:hypothetical protein
MRKRREGLPTVRNPLAIMIRCFYRYVLYQSSDL